MMRALLMVLSASFVYAAPLSVGETNQGVDLRIVGGVEVQAPNPWPWLGYMTNVGCGANLLNDNWFMTAAHCILTDNDDGFVSPSVVTVVFGCLDRTSNTCIKRGASRVVPHPCYETHLEHDDIALIKLDQPVNSTAIGVATPDTTGVGLTAGTSVTLLGWGSTTGDGSTPATRLREVTVAITSQARCQEQNPEQLREGTLNFNQVICTGGEAGKDSCNGDSGGPAVIRRDNKWVVVGLSSTGSELPLQGDNCAAEGRLGVYTRVASSWPWVQGVMSGASGDTGGCVNAAASLSPNVIVVLIALLVTSALAMVA